MPPFQDITGQRFGRWTVQSRDGDSFAWHCVCDCGTRKRVQASALKNGSSTSCGCYAREVAAKHIVSVNYRHGGASQHDRATYSVWASMKARCGNPKTPNFGLYGGRGIKVCERWRDFANFADDMGPRPDGYSIERIDNDGDYEPTNCRWATRKEQNRNTQRNKMLVHDGQTRCISEWAEIAGIHEAVIRQRLFLGWDTAKALTAPLRITKRRRK